MTNINLIKKKAVALTLNTQRLDNVFLAGDFLKWSRGSDSDLYTQARWCMVDAVVDSNGDETDLPVADADPEASLAGELMQRYKQKVVIVAAGKEALRGVINNNNAKTAVVSAIGEILIAGVLDDNEGRMSLKLGLDPEEYVVTAGLRAGKSRFPVGLAAYVEQDKKIIKPDGMYIYAQNIPIADLPEAAPLGTRFF